MKIVIKANHIAPGGGLTHFNHTCKWFARLKPNWQFIVLGKEGQQKLFNENNSNFEYHYFTKPSDGKLAQFLWKKFDLPKIVNEYSPELFFVPGNYSGNKIKCPIVTLVHNIAPFSKRYIAKESLYQKFRLNLLRFMTIKSLQKSDGIIFLSEYCRRYFAKFYDTKKNKAITAHHGRPDNNLSLDQFSILNDYNISDDYILSVSHVYEYKKIKEMIDGYLLALERKNNLPPLIIAGTPYDKKYLNTIQDKINRTNNSKNIRFIGNVPEEKLSALYSNCSAFIFSSSLETCSVILIEAMANGCPIICSNKTVMPEITGHTAVYYNPSNIKHLSELILQVLSDKELSRLLKKYSLAMAMNYSWEKSSASILDFFCQLTDTKTNKFNKKSYIGV